MRRWIGLSACVACEIACIVLAVIELRAHDDVNRFVLAITVATLFGCFGVFLMPEETSNHG